jgi:hypothetical protein
MPPRHRFQFTTTTTTAQRLLLVLCFLVVSQPPCAVEAKGEDKEHTFKAQLREKFPFVECVTTKEVVYTRAAAAAVAVAESTTVPPEEQQWILVTTNATTASRPTGDDAVYHPCPCAAASTTTTTPATTPTEVCPAHLPVCRFYQQGGNEVVCLLQTSSDAAVAQLFRWTFVGLTLVVALLAACSQEGRWAGQYLQRTIGRRCTHAAAQQSHRANANTHHNNDDDEYEYDPVLQLQARAILDGTSGLPGALVEDFCRMAQAKALVAAAQAHRSVRLNVKRFVSSSQQEEAAVCDDNDDDDDLDNPQAPTCAICLEMLAQGTIVGDIPCGHYFHKACLKEWIPKRNSCPLCQEPLVVLGFPRNSGSSRRRRRGSRNDSHGAV